MQGDLKNLFFAAESFGNQEPFVFRPRKGSYRGDIFMARKMYREAIELYSEAPQDSAVVWNKMGIAYHQMMQLDAAMKRYQRSIRLDPKYPEAINNLGTIYYAEKRYGKATQYYKRALKLAPKSSVTYAYGASSPRSWRLSSPSQTWTSWRSPR